MLQLALTVSIYLLIVIPAGVYLYHIAAGKHTFADPVFDRVDGAIYKISGVDPGKGMNWKQYALALLGTNAVMVFIGYLIVPFPVSWTVKMKKKQKETQDILSYHTQAAGCSDKARAKASGGRQPIEECGRTGL